jgi:hypothetical protein
MPNPLATDLLRAADPAALFAVTGKRPDPWQARAVRSTARRLLLNCCRQSGKGEVMSVLAAHQAMTVPDSLSLLVSPGLRQSQELAMRTRALVRSLALTTSKDNALELVLENGSRIVSLPGSEGTVRGFAAVDLLLIDEASRVPDELYAAVRPMLAVADRARIVAASTPFGMRGWWWEAWDQGGDAWERYRVPATEVQRISAEFLAEELAALGRWWYGQEYLCEFVEASGQLFRQSDIDAAFEAGRGVPGLFGLFPEMRPKEL